MDRFVAYDTTTEWMSPTRASRADAELDARCHNNGCTSQGGYGSASVFLVREDDYLDNGEGYCVWPPHGRSTGAVRVLR